MKGFSRPKRRRIAFHELPSKAQGSKELPATPKRVWPPTPKRDEIAFPSPAIAAAMPYSPPAKLSLDEGLDRRAMRMEGQVQHLNLNAARSPAKPSPVHTPTNPTEAQRAAFRLVPSYGFSMKLTDGRTLAQPKMTPFTPATLEPTLSCAPILKDSRSFIENNVAPTTDSISIARPVSEPKKQISGPMKPLESAPKKTKVPKGRKGICSFCATECIIALFKEQLCSECHRQRTNQLQKQRNTPFACEGKTRQDGSILKACDYLLSDKSTWPKPASIKNGIKLCKKCVDQAKMEDLNPAERLVERPVARPAEPLVARPVELPVARPVDSLGYPAVAADQVPTSQVSIDFLAALPSPTLAPDQSALPVSVKALPSPLLAALPSPSSSPALAALSSSPFLGSDEELDAIFGSGPNSPSFSLLGSEFDDIEDCLTCPPAPCANAETAVRSVAQLALSEDDSTPEAHFVFSESLFDGL